MLDLVLAIAVPRWWWEGYTENSEGGWCSSLRDPVWFASVGSVLTSVSSGLRMSVGWLREMLDPFLLLWVVKTNMVELGARNIVVNICLTASL